MKPLHRYRVTFQGRERGAIGLMYTYTVEVEAYDEAGARLKVYDTHEHLMHVEITDLGEVNK